MVKPFKYQPIEAEIDQLEDLIEKEFSQLKPELSKNYEYIFRNFDNNEKGPVYHHQASLVYGLTKNIIIFFTHVILGRIKHEKWDDENAINYIRRLISHEITHRFTTSELDANKRQIGNKYFIN